jgi:hypothetical protein
MRSFIFSVILALSVVGTVTGQCDPSSNNPLLNGISTDIPPSNPLCTNEGATATLMVDWGMTCTGIPGCITEPAAPAGSWGVKIILPSSGMVPYGVTDATSVTVPSLFTWFYDAPNKTLLGFSNTNIAFGAEGTIEVQLEALLNNSCSEVTLYASIFKTSVVQEALYPGAAIRCISTFSDDIDDNDLDISFGVDIALPVQITSFKGQERECETVDLSWATASETNNQKFIVERQLGTKQNFVAVGEVSGAGTSSTEVLYTFQDRITESFPNGSAYYRLKQVDFNGKFQFSNVISVDVPCREEAVASVFPNPVVKDLTLQLPSLWEGDAVTVEFYNEQGKLLRVEQINQVADLKVKFNVGDLPTGVYNLKLSNSASTINKRFVRLD